MISDFIIHVLRWELFYFSDFCWRTQTSHNAAGSYIQYREMNDELRQLEYMFVAILCKACKHPYKFQCNLFYYLSILVSVIIHPSFDGYACKCLIYQSLLLP